MDNLCCFLRPGEVALTWTDDKSDPQYDISMDAYERLISTVDAHDRKLTVHKIHQPAPILISRKKQTGVIPVEGTLPREAGARMAASYINFYICNHGVIVPIFGDPHDQSAIDTISRLMPDHKVVGIPAREILLGGGNIHCITQQQPLGRIMQKSSKFKLRKFINHILFKFQSAFITPANNLIPDEQYSGVVVLSSTFSDFLQTTAQPGHYKTGCCQRHGG